MRIAALMVMVLGSVALAQPAKPRAKNDPREHISVPYETPCPTIAKPTGDPKRLASTDGLQIDPDGFLRADIGIAEAASLLGTPVLCSHEATSAYWNIFLLPAAAGVRTVYLETEDDALIGIVVELDPPATIDMTKVGKKFGTSRLLMAPYDSFEAGGLVFAPKTATFTGQLMYSHREQTDKDTAWKVYQIIFRRHAIADQLPDGFHTQADVDRLVALALRKAAPDPVDFYGTVGVYDKTTGDRITFLPALASRNVKSATLEKRTRAGRDYVHAMTIAFTKPIAIAKPVAIPGVTRTIIDGKLTAISVIRDEP